jgi:hypothetical protein
VGAEEVKAGIHLLSADEYRADPCDKPSLSSSIAAILCSQSPAHAWVAHPKLNPDFERAEKPHFDLGTVVHQLLLEGHTDSLVTIDAENFRTKVAQEARDAAYADGKTPILIGELPRVNAMVAAVGEQLRSHTADPPLFTDGKAEQSLVWGEAGGIVCRARLDWLRDDHRTIDDLKTTSRSANPEQWTRTIFGMGYDVQAAWYLRGLKAVTGADAEFRLAVIETSRPFALSVIGFGPDILTLARKKVEYALSLWRDCLVNDSWPGYPQQVCYAGLPAWEEGRWLEKEEMFA